MFIYRKRKSKDLKSAQYTTHIPITTCMDREDRRASWYRIPKVYREKAKRDTTKVPELLGGKPWASRRGCENYTRDSCKGKENNAIIYIKGKVNNVVVCIKNEYRGGLYLTRGLNGLEARHGSSQ